MPDSILQMIGLSKRAGRCVSGDYRVIDAIRSGEAALVIIAADASENTKKRFKDKCKYADIPICFYGTKQQLGKFTGKEQAAAAAVTDSGFAGKIEAMIREVQI